MDNLNASKHFRLETLADGVYVAYAKEDGAAWGNAGIIDLGDCTLVYDTFVTPQAANDLKAAAEALTGRAVKLVANSHWHLDHVVGNQVFDADTAIYATAYTREKLLRDGMADIQRAFAEAATEIQVLTGRLAYEPDDIARADIQFSLAYLRGMMQAAPSVNVRVPNRTVEGKLTLHGSERSAELIHFGANHTGGDLALHLPNEGIMFVGDLLFVQHHPWLGEADGHLEHWRETLKTIAGMKPKAIVPGHGPAGKNFHLKELHDYIQSVEEIVQELVEQAAMPDEVATNPIPKSYKAWRFAINNYPDSLRALHERMAAEYDR